MWQRYIPVAFPCCFRVGQCSTPLSACYCQLSREVGFVGKGLKSVEGAGYLQAEAVLCVNMAPGLSPSWSLRSDDSVALIARVESEHE